MFQSQGQICVFRSKSIPIRPRKLRGRITANTDTTNIICTIFDTSSCWFLMYSFNILPSPCHHCNWPIRTIMINHHTKRKMQSRKMTAWYFGYRARIIPSTPTPTSSTTTVCNAQATVNIIHNYNHWFEFINAQSAQSSNFETKKIRFHIESIFNCWDKLWTLECLLNTWCNFAIIKLSGNWTHCWWNDTG